MSAGADMTRLLADIRACRICEEALGFAPRPIVQAGPDARVLIVGQAPGSKVHASGFAWDDDSGDRLRGWLEMDRETFYDPEQVALVPMGLCYPGKGNGGDLPPRPECAPLWHDRLLAEMPGIRLTLLVGHYAERGPIRSSALAVLSLQRNTHEKHRDADDEPNDRRGV